MAKHTNHMTRRVLGLTLVLSTGAWLAQPAFAGPPTPGGKPPSAQDVGNAAAGAAGNAANAAGTAATNTTDAAAAAARAAADKLAEEARRLDAAKVKLNELKPQMEAKARQLANTLAQQVPAAVRAKIEALVAARTTQNTTKRGALDRIKADRAARAAAAATAAGGAAQVKPGPTGGLKTGGTAKPLAAGEGPLPTVIQDLDQAAGEPDEWILLTGTGFERDMEVFFHLAQNRDEKGELDFWDSTKAAVKVPNPMLTGPRTGLPAFNGNIYIKRTGAPESNRKPFRFIPLTTVSFLPADLILRNAEISTAGYESTSRTWPPSSGPDCACVNHSVLLTGARGDDVFFRNLRLKNGWLVDEIKLVNADPRPPVGERVEGSHLGTDDLRFTVHWWCDPWFAAVAGSEGYEMVVYIRGPEGVPYQ